MKQALRARTRIEMKLRTKGIPSIPVLGRYNHVQAMPGLRDHKHSGVIEICFLERGRQTYYVGGKRYCLRGGDLFLTFPGEAHGTGGEPQEKGLLYWLSVRDPANTNGSLLGLPVSESKELWKALRHLHHRRFPGTPEMKNHLEAVTALVHRPWSVLSRTEATNRLVAFLLGIVSANNAAAERSTRSRLQPVFDHIESHLDDLDALVIARLADIAQLSPSRFKTLFKAETGIPPAEFALRARIHEAADRLRKSGGTVTSVAFGMGFSSSQYFASTFKRFTNRSPSHYLVKRD